MLAPGSRIHGNVYSPENSTILSASAHLEDHVYLRRVLGPAGWTVERARTLAEARGMLRESSPSVIFCERDLPDGCWRDLLAETRTQQPAPPLVVISGQADEVLWAEVLNLGGYDVLLKPFDGSEVTRVLGMASREWSRQHQSGAPLSAAVMPFQTPESR